LGDLCHRNGFGLLGDMPNDGKSPVERPIGFRSLCHGASPITPNDLIKLSFFGMKYT
jgi:hypothetical protein